MRRREHRRHPRKRRDQEHCIGKRVLAASVTSETSAKTNTQEATIPEDVAGEIYSRCRAISDECKNPDLCDQISTELVTVIMSCDNTPQTEVSCEKRNDNACIAESVNGVAKISGKTILFENQVQSSTSNILSEDGTSETTPVISPDAEKLAQINQRPCMPTNNGISMRLPSNRKVHSGRKNIRLVKSSGLKVTTVTTKGKYKMTTHRDRMVRFHSNSNPASGASPIETGFRRRQPPDFQSNAGYATQLTRPRYDVFDRGRQVWCG
jgi:hypothetical protein